MSTNGESATRVLGSLRSVGGLGVVRMEDRFDTDIDDLWSALTDPTRLARWLGTFEGDLRTGGEFRAVFHASGWEGTGRVEACERPRRFVVRTRQSSEDYEMVVEATLTAIGDRTNLVIEERGMPLSILAAWGAGDQVHMEDLVDHIAGRERRAMGTRWDDVMPAYQALAADVRTSE
jgi:uncharacterized protein YndB with AHSA1/START domain